MKKLLLLVLFIVGCVFSQKFDSSENTLKYIDNNLSIGIGIGTIKVFDVAQISYDIKLGQNTSLFGYLGLPIVIGSGISWQQNYEIIFQHHRKTFKHLNLKEWTMFFISHKQTPEEKYS